MDTNWDDLKQKGRAKATRVEQAQREVDVWREGIKTTLRLVMPLTRDAFGSAEDLASEHTPRELAKRLLAFYAACKLCPGPDALNRKRLPVHGLGHQAAHRILDVLEGDPTQDTLTEEIRAAFTSLEPQGSLAPTDTVAGIFDVFGAIAGQISALERGFLSRRGLEQRLVAPALAVLDPDEVEKKDGRRVAHSATPDPVRVDWSQSRSGGQPLIGWKAICEHIGQPHSDAQRRWLKALNDRTGGPIRRLGRRPMVDGGELQSWIEHLDEPPANEPIGPTTVAQAPRDEPAAGATGLSVSDTPNQKTRQRPS